MPLPNFFIIGAARAGTTALYHSLRQHPEIYMSPVKEPCFFIFEGNAPVFAGAAGRDLERSWVKRPDDYLSLFADATDRRAIGEASTLYLSWPGTARRIHDALPESKIVVILRQPAEHAYSHYVFAVWLGWERAGTFSDALALASPLRSKGWMSKYELAGYYHAQLTAYYSLFLPNQIKAYLYEDWRDAPNTMLRDLFGFLNVDPDFVTEQKRYLVSQMPRNRRVHQFATAARQNGSNPSRSRLAGIEQTAQSLIWRLNNKYNKVPAPPLDPTIRAQLTEIYSEDILMLQNLIGRDLSHWLNRAPENKFQRGKHGSANP